MVPTREELHALVDALPEGAIEAAHRILSGMQVWPPPPPPDAEEMRKRMEQRRWDGDTFVQETYIATATRPHTARDLVTSR